MSGYVYFIAPEAVLHRHWGDDGKVVKIGFTRSDPNARLRTLQTGCPLPLKLWAYAHGNEVLELAFHRTFAPLRHIGEWFHAIHKLDDLLGYLGNEPDVGHLIDEEQFAGMISDTIFTDLPPHPSIDRHCWQGSAHPEHLAPFFPDEWAAYLTGQAVQ